MKKQRYRVLKPYNGAAVGDIISMRLAQGSRKVHDGTVEPVPEVPLELRVAEYEHRILTGGVKPGEVALLRYMQPVTVARIHSRSVSGYKVKTTGQSPFQWVDFNPIDWSRFWVDSGLRIQRWQELPEDHLLAITRGSYEHRPGADEAAEKEYRRREKNRRGTKDSKRSLKELMGVPRVKEAVRRAISSACQVPARFLGYGLNDRQDARHRIAKRLGVDPRYVSKEQIDTALAAAPPGPSLHKGATADVCGFLDNRFSLFGKPEVDLATQEVSLFVLFGEAEVEATFGADAGGAWHWSSGEREDVVSDTLALACDDFEAWVREQVANKPSKPRAKVTRHIGTGDMGGLR